MFREIYLADDFKNNVRQNSAEIIGGTRNTNAILGTLYHKYCIKSQLINRSTKNIANISLLMPVKYH